MNRQQFESLAPGKPHRLPGEIGQYRVYRVDFDTGASYAGCTSRPIITRFRQHLAEPKSPISKHLLEHPEADFSIQCVISNLTKNQGNEIERLTVKSLAHPLNFTVPKAEKYAPQICKVDGCGREVHAKSLCMKHYRRLLRTGSTDARQPKVCRRSGCNQPTHADDCCMTHYQAIRRMKIRHGTWNPNQHKEAQ